MCAPSLIIGGQYTGVNVLHRDGVHAHYTRFAATGSWNGLLISVSAHPRSSTFRSACAACLTLLMMAACGSEEPNREFAPEINDEQVIETATLVPTSTPAALNRQPGETGPGSGNVTELIEQTGPVLAVPYGLEELSVLTIADTAISATGVPQAAGTVSALAPDGTLLLSIERSNGAAEVVGRSLSGKEVARWQPPSDGTPVATPSTPVNVHSGDHIEWDAQSAHALVSIGRIGVFIADRELNLTPVAPDQLSTITTAAWAPTGQSVALASWDTERKAANIQTVALQDMTRLTSVLELAESDGRFVRSMAWGNESVGLVFTLRAVGQGFALPSDLYQLPRFGQPMRLLATAGAAAPAAVIDQIAIASNGSTVAYTVLIPGDVGYRYHSLWLTDAATPGVTRIDTPGLRRVSDLLWTSDGLALVATRRAAEGDNQYLIAVVTLVTSDELTDIGEVRSAATPIGSPRASPADSANSPTPAD